MARKQTDRNSKPASLWTMLFGGGTQHAKQPDHTYRTTSTDDQNTIRRYLLGQLTDDWQQQVEERLLTEDDLFEESEIVEDELIDEYLAKKLSDAERDRFEQYFLATPERHQSLRFARVLNRYVMTHPGPKPIRPDLFLWRFWPSQRLVFRLATAVAVVAIIAGALWLSPRPLRPLTTQPQTLAALTLTISAANRAAGDQAPKVSLPLNADALRIALRLPDSSAPAVRYRVELVNDNGETKSLAIAEQDAQSVSVVIPAAQLARGSYALKLFAIKADGTEERISGSYFFSVE
jgi:methionine-rich copper-binding protein CopC